MKKLLSILAVLFVMAVSPTVATAQTPCHTGVLTCPDGSTHIVVYCDAQDWWTWSQIYCGIAIS
jgi:hypothetical protein